MLVVIFFGLLAGASFDKSGNLSGWIWFLVISMIVGVIVAIIEENKNEKKRREKATAEYQDSKQRAAEQEKKYNEWYDKYININGTPNKAIVIEPNNSHKVIFVHEHSKKVFIQGKLYDFKEIMNCTFTDSPTIIKGKVTSTTKSSTGSTVGRAIVGDIVAGPAGAIIGGTTGKKTTEFHQENDKVVHYYTVVINVDSISSPIVRIYTGSDGKLTNEIVGLMNVIIARK